MYLFHAQSTLSRRSSVQQPVVGVWSCENKVRKRVEVKSKILQSSGKKALKTSLEGNTEEGRLRTSLNLIRVGSWIGSNRGRPREGIERGWNGTW